MIFSDIRIIYINIWRNFTLGNLKFKKFKITKNYKLQNKKLWEII